MLPAMPEVRQVCVFAGGDVNLATPRAADEVEPNPTPDWPTFPV
jgi:hypothetical protein